MCHLGLRVLMEMSNKQYDNLTSTAASESSGKVTMQKTAVVVHFYYQDLWSEIRDRLLFIDTDFDLFVTVPEDLRR